MREPKRSWVDLRNNPGGYLTETGLISAAFLNDGDLVHRIVSVHSDQSANAGGDGIAADAIAFPMAIAVNGRSASGSELFALAMRGNSRAKIVGSTTFGKHTGQQTFAAEGVRWYVVGCNTGDIVEILRGRATSALRAESNLISSNQYRAARIPSVLCVSQCRRCIPECQNSPSRRCRPRLPTRQAKKSRWLSLLTFRYLLIPQTESHTLSCRSEPRCVRPSISRH